MSHETQMHIQSSSIAGKAGHEVMRQLAVLMRQTGSCRLSLCYLLHDDGARLLPAACCGVSGAVAKTFQELALVLEELPLLSRLVRQPLRLVTWQAVPEGLLPERVASVLQGGCLLCLPMQALGSVTGVAFALRDLPFREDELTLLGWEVSHAALAGHALSLVPPEPEGLLPELGEGIWLNPGMHGMFINTVSTLVNAIEAKSPWTKGHSERVMRICAIIAASLGLSAVEVERVRLGGLLHDIGKIGVVEQILDNPEPLRAEDSPHLKLHPEKGVAILAPIPELRGVLPGILHHHERFDGEGYPGRLNGCAIPLDARIIAVADAFDAIVSERPYKSAAAVSEALRELKRCAGSHFDPVVVRSLSGFMQEEGKEAGRSPA